ncbi:hypothetical protein [Microbacterium sp. LWH12-1.2]|uniref:hypothetical protein n=1 Tax=Microbacterium sp. LWH12-1.2 TaxID=3135259 RepID=UPI003432CA22
MTSGEELIEEAAKALFMDGDGLDSSPETRAIWEPRIRAALAVFEKARGPMCICTSAIAGISDGPNVDCPHHGQGETWQKVSRGFDGTRRAYEALQDTTVRAVLMCAHCGDTAPRVPSRRIALGSETEGV